MPYLGGKKPPTERFWKFVRKRKGRGCWVWKGSVAPNGYGHFYIGPGFGVSGMMNAHRASYLLFVGPLAPGQVVRHKCDNPLCVRPDHLEAGTQGDNCRDTILRGRNRPNAPRGEANHMTKLTEDQAREARELYATGKWGLRMLGVRYGVTGWAIFNVVTGRTWKHLGPPIHREVSRFTGSHAGERNVHAVLTEDAVRAIRGRYEAGNVTQRQLAEEYGVTRSCIGNIITRRAWPHVN